MKRINSFSTQQLSTKEANALKGGVVFCEWVIGRSDNMTAGMNSMNADDTANGHESGNK